MKEILRVEGTAFYKADIFLVGIGMFALNQLTIEGLHVLSSVKQIVHTTAVHARLCKINRNCMDIGHLTSDFAVTWESCERLANRVLEVAAKCTPIAFVGCGNPMLFDDVNWEIARLGKARGFSVQAVPGISAIDVLPIQLGFDIGDLGTQLFEASHLVRLNLTMNPFLSTMILQIAEFGLESEVSRSTTYQRLLPVFRHLEKFYSTDHPLTFLRTRSTMDEKEIFVSTTLGTVSESTDAICRGMTLYVPRIGIPDWPSERTPR